jgi:hypothetical protein
MDERIGLCRIISSLIVGEAMWRVFHAAVARISASRVLSLHQPPESLRLPTVTLAGHFMHWIVVSKL